MDTLIGKLVYFLLAFVISVRCVSSDDSTSKKAFEIIRQNCLGCHSESNAENSLLLDSRPSKLFEGVGVENNKIYQVISGSHPELTMPPENPLSDDQIKLIRLWIEMGAEWPQDNLDRLWSLESLDSRWDSKLDLSDTIDRIISNSGAKIDTKANEEVLFRRLFLDITGLIPTLAEREQFSCDSVNQFVNLVEYLLSSERYGEHWGRHWLDLVAFAETDGFAYDTIRPNGFLFRNWVIDALNQNLPYDSFVKYQIAGDLLRIDSSKPSSLEGVGFLRCGPHNHEDGTDPKEERHKALVERVNTLGKATLGLSMECARCHDHKWDPITQKEYFQFFAFFNQTKHEECCQNSRQIDARDSRLTEIQNELNWLQTKLHYKSNKGNNLLLFFGGGVLSWVGIVTLAFFRRWKICFAFLFLLGFVSIIIVWSLGTDNSGIAQANVSRIRQLADEKNELKKLTPLHALIVRDDLEKSTFVRIRGDYEQKGKKVNVQIPNFISPSNSMNLPSRLDLADAISKSPLFARVRVNRIWFRLFGNGIVNSLDDFGFRGTEPDSRELLDTLASFFVQSGYDQKLLIKKIVLSNAYQQRSRSMGELYDQPDRLGIQTQFQLSAESIIDTRNLLAGRLNIDHQRGIGVQFEMPEGYTKIRSTVNLQFHSKTHVPRAIYHFRKRTVLHPSLSELCAPNGEKSVSRRECNFSTQQALALLNDPEVLSASIGLATKLLRCSRDKGEIINRLIMSLFCRKATKEEIKLLGNAWAQFTSDVESQTNKRVDYRVNSSAATHDLNPEVLSGLACVVRSLFATNEFVTRY